MTDNNVIRWKLLKRNIRTGKYGCTQCFNEQYLKSRDTGQEPLSLRDVGKVKDVGVTFAFRFSPHKPTFLHSYHGENNYFSINTPWLYIRSRYDYKDSCKGNHKFDDIPVEFYIEAVGCSQTKLGAKSKKEIHPCPMPNQDGFNVCSARFEFTQEHLLGLDTEALAQLTYTTWFSSSFNNDIQNNTDNLIHYENENRNGSPLLTYESYHDDEGPSSMVTMNYLSKLSPEEAKEVWCSAYYDSMLLSDFMNETYMGY
jgi:hypothetical protein